MISPKAAEPPEEEKIVNLKQQLIDQYMQSKRQLVEDEA